MRGEISGLVVGVLFLTFSFPLEAQQAGDIPVEQPTKTDFVINLKAAKQIGLTIRPEVLARANKIIR